MYNTNTSVLTINKKKEKTIKTIFKILLFIGTLATIVLLVSNITALAAVDPVTAINNLKDYMASIFEAIGVIAVLFGVLILVLGLMSHDPTQRLTGIIAIAAGILLAGATAVVNYIVNGG